MKKRSASKHKEMLLQAKEEMEAAGNAVLIDSKSNEYKTIFTPDKTIVNKTLRDEGLTKKQAVNKKRRELIRNERSLRYQQIIAGTWQSNLKFEHTSEEQYGNMLQFNDKVPNYFLLSNDVPANSIVLLVNSSSFDVGNEGRMISVLAPNGTILDIRASWVNSLN